MWIEEEEVTAARDAVWQPVCGGRKCGNNKDRREEKAPTGQISDLVRRREGGNKRDETSETPRQQLGKKQGRNTDGNHYSIQVNSNRLISEKGIQMRTTVSSQIRTGFEIANVFDDI